MTPSAPNVPIVAPTRKIRTRRLGVSRWLSFAAMPVFAVMAAATAVHVGDTPGALCSVIHKTPLSGMTVMYALMSAFHLPPWLKSIACRRYRTAVQFRS
jgi:hypothetical protein